MPAGITTITTMTEQVARLLAWLSPAFPTGGYAYSHGIEWAVEAGWVADEATLLPWLADIFEHGAGRSDALLLRHAHAAAWDGVALAEIAERAAASAPGRERQQESCAQGDAFCRAATPWMRGALAGLSGVAYPVAVGALAGAHGIAVAATAAAYAQAVASNLISAAVRLVPLGQSAGLRVLAALEPVLAGMLAETSGLGLDALGGACFRSDIFSLRHETQYTRLFRS